MRFTHGLTLVAATVIGPLVVADAAAQVTRIDFQVVESPAFDGESFGNIGQYERLRGVAYGEVDPNDVRHRGIVDLDKAPLNARGRVEYGTTVEIYRPIDLGRWNKAIYHIVPNRGGASAGDAVFREMGFAIVQVGWQGDLTPTDRNIVPSLPIATYEDGSSIIGPAVEEFIFNDQETVSEAGRGCCASDETHPAVGRTRAANRTGHPASACRRGRGVELFVPRGGVDR